MLLAKFSTTGIEEAISAFENKHSFSFPESYRSFLVSYNGGRTPNTGFHLGAVTSDVRGFYGLGHADQYLNYTFYENTHTLGEFLEDGYIPIADNVFSDDVVIGITPENKGRIYFRFHDLVKNYVLIAEDFASFVNACSSAPLEVANIKTRKKTAKKNGNGNRIEILMQTWEAEIALYGSLKLEEVRY